MEKAQPKASLTAWVQSRLDLEPAISGKIIHTRLPDRSTFSRQSRGSRKIYSTYPECKNEDEYSKRRSAVDGGVHLRSVKKSPRSILWRCLGDRSTLELRSVDLSQGGDDDAEKKDSNATYTDAPLILQYTFPSAIRNGCVGFADSEHGDTLFAFVLTENKDLYTLRIHSSWFVAEEKSDEDSERWCYTSRPGTLNFGQVLRLSSATTNELLFSTTDGRIVRLTRQSGADGSSWQETAYSEGQWSSLRGLIPWQGGSKIRWEGHSVDPTSSLVSLPAPTGKHLISVTASHQLKIWNLESGKSVFDSDILGIEHEVGEAPGLTLDPGFGRVLAIDSTISSAGAPDGQYYVFTYSPHQGGNFKVWVVRDAEFGNEGVKDVFPEYSLHAPSPDDNAVWSLADFKISSVPNSRKVSFWIMLRLNRRYKIYHKEFTDILSLATEWSKDWERTHIPEATNCSLGEEFTIPASEPLALALDTVHGLPWVVSSDSVAALRATSQIEELVYNTPKILSKNASSLVRSIEDDAMEGVSPSRSDLATVIEAAAQFRAGLYDLSLAEATRNELWADSLNPRAVRMEVFYRMSGLDYIGSSERCYKGLVAALEGLREQGVLTNTLFDEIISEKLPSSRLGGTRRHTAFGRKACVGGAQDMIIMHERIVKDLLYMLVFMVQGLDKDDLHAPDLQHDQIFQQLVEKLKQIEVTQWISSHKRAQSSHRVTLLEEIFSQGIHFPPYKSMAASASLTAAIEDLLVLSGGGTPHADLRGENQHPSGASWGEIEVAPHVLCFLLAHEERRLATAFLRYLPTNAWSTYVRARYHLAMHEHGQAAIHFKKAAPILAHGPTVVPAEISQRSARLLNDIDASHFTSGMSKYYAHVVELFSAPSVQAHAQAVAFASLGLQSLNFYKHPERSTQQRSEFLSRLFHANLALGDYDGGVAALSRYTDKALRKAALKSLATDMLGAGAIHELIDMTLSEAMKKELDGILADRARGDAESEAETAAAAKILYAWRIKQRDYRGAAACLVERLGGRRPGQKKRPRVRASGSKDAILDDYLISINALSLLGKSEGVEEGDNEGWLFVEDGDKDGRRSLVRLKDLRRGYQDEMDRQERWAKGQFALTAADEDEEDEDGDTIMAT